MVYELVGGFLIQVSGHTPGLPDENDATRRSIGEELCGLMTVLEKPSGRPKVMHRT